jgi:hypothetical protein
MVEELTMLLKGGNFCSPSGFWDYQEAAGYQADLPEYEKRVVRTVKRYMNEYNTGEYFSRL